MIIHLHGATDLEITGIEEPGMHVHGDADGEGFSALQMLAGSMALCTASVLAGYARGVLKKDASTLSVRVTWKYEERPFRVGAMHVAVRWPDLPEERIDAAQRAVKSCTVHRTFEHPPALTSEVRNG